MRRLRHGVFFSRGIRLDHCTILRHPRLRDTVRAALDPAISKGRLTKMARFYPTEVLANPVTTLYALEDPTWRVPLDAMRRLLIQRLRRNRLGFVLEELNAYSRFVKPGGHGAGEGGIIQEAGLGQISGAGPYEGHPRLQAGLDDHWRRIYRGDGCSTPFHMEGSGWGVGDVYVPPPPGKGLR